MALIVLEQGEVFEHFHEGETTTRLLDGSVEFQVGERHVEMALGRDVVVPARTLHRMKNMGQGSATLSCSGH